MKIHPQELGLARAYDTGRDFEALSAEQLHRIMERGRELYQWFKTHPGKEEKGRLHEPVVFSPFIVWIDRGTFLLRKIEEDNQYETFQTQSATTYEPEVGVQVTEDKLRFDPPETS